MGSDKMGRAFWRPPIARSRKISPRRATQPQRSSPVHESIAVVDSARDSTSTTTVSPLRVGESMPKTTRGTTPHKTSPPRTSPVASIFPPASGPGSTRRPRRGSSGSMRTAKPDSSNSTVCSPDCPRHSRGKTEDRVFSFWHSAANTRTGQRRTERPQREVERSVGDHIVCHSSGAHRHDIAQMGRTPQQYPGASRA